MSQAPNLHLLMQLLRVNTKYNHLIHKHVPQKDVESQDDCSWHQGLVDIALHNRLSWPIMHLGHQLESIEWYKFIHFKLPLISNNNFPCLNRVLSQKIQRGSPNVTAYTVHLNNNNVSKLSGFNRPFYRC